MADSHRGEIEAVLDGRPHRLCLTLGALAELESAFGDPDIPALANRFSGGRLKAADAARLIGAGLRGGGHPLSDEIVTTMTADGGAVGFIDIVARLLAATFGPAASLMAEIAVPLAGVMVPTAEPGTPPLPSPEEGRTPAPVPPHHAEKDQSI
jgi:Phage tail tube protein, GTA-gp10